MARTVDTRNVSSLLDSLMKGLPDAERRRLAALLRERELTDGAPLTSDGVSRSARPPVSPAPRRPLVTDGRRYLVALVYRSEWQWHATVQELRDLAVTAMSLDELPLAVAAAAAAREGRSPDDYVVRLDNANEL